jgi:S-adenosylmethionine-diacylglycerol 3-amino-3-carboxypropyl transferase
VDRLALRLTPADRVLVITSAGCNALDYALTGAKVVAVDANPRQNHLLELKRAGIRALDFDAFFTLFGDGGGPATREIYAAVRPELPPPSREFWDREIRLFDARGRSFYYRGTSGLVALAFRFYADHVARFRGVLDRLLASTSISEQQEIYRRDLRARLLHDGLCDVVGSAAVLALLGVPEAQRRMVHAHQGGFAGFLRACLDHVMGVALLRDNYFWRVYVTGRYARESCPEYLKRENFLRLKAGLVENIEVFTGTVTERLTLDREGLTAFVLLDHMDWLAGRAQLLEEEWRRLFEAAAPAARVIFRSGAADARFLPGWVTERLRFETERASELHRLDRVGTYGSFHIAHVPAAA